MSRTIIADVTKAIENETDTPAQTGLNNKYAGGVDPYEKAQGQTPGAATCGE